MYNAPAYASGYMYVQPNESPVLAYQVSPALLPCGKATRVWRARAFAYLLSSRHVDRDLSPSRLNTAQSRPTLWSIAANGVVCRVCDCRLHLSPLHHAHGSKRPHPPTDLTHIHRHPAFAVP